MSYKCVNSRNGCKFSVPQKSPTSDLTNHEQQCKYRKSPPAPVQGAAGGEAGSPPSGPAAGGGGGGGSAMNSSRRNSFECINSAKGCTFKVEHSELQDHENECRYRKILCPDGLCKSKVVLRDLVDHIRQVHPDADWETESGDTALRNWFISKDLHFGPSSNNWVLNLWEHDNMVFIARFRKARGLWYSWVYVLGGIRDALGYRCIINTASAEVDSRLTYEGPVHCIDESEVDICSSGDCLVMCDNMIDLYMEKVKRVDVYTEGYDGRLPIDYMLRRDDQIS